jgi:Transposase DDE domain
VTPVDLITAVYCVIDDLLKDLDLPRLRQRGPDPTLADSEVIAIELAGEFWGLDADARLFWHFRAYHRAEFPHLADVTRTSFLRQAANLWQVKQLLQQRLADRLVAGDPLWLVDSLPVPACQFARATFCERFGGAAAYGYDHLIKRTFYGFRLHLRVSRDGIILAAVLAPANIPDAAVVAELEPPPGSVGVGDRAYWAPERRAALSARGVVLLAPYYHKSRDPDPARSSRLASVRYRVETVGGQLAGRYQVKRTWAKDLWHLCHRVIRKVLSHTVLVLLTARAGHAPLSFHRLNAA